ncbi:MAG: FAD-dependent oxidoreductase, partial [Bacteroidales bacterium]|nr:FAD-dependent oxidoreductase [Bacteroidales bacterium]
AHGIEVTGDATPRGPLSNPLNLGEVYPRNAHDTIITPSKITEKPIKVKALIAGGGMAGSALFRYMSEAGFKPVLVNNDRGSTWRCLAGGRPAFSHPAIADLAMHNLEIFKDLQAHGNIDYKPTRYVSFAHDEATYKALEKSIEWSDAYMIEQKDFRKEISEYFNPNLKTYSHALISHNCWQATPGKTINMVRNIAMSHGGVLLENTEVLDVEKIGNEYRVLMLSNDGKYLEYHAEIFVNALGANAGIFAGKLGIETGLYPIKHQAFITRRMPLIGKDGDSLDMLIDRRHYRGFSAVYGQQMKETGQFIVCASPAVDAIEAGKNIKVNTQDFLEVCSDVCCDWIPEFANVGIQATWAGYYTEPRYIVDPELGLLVGMRGHGFMLSQYIARLYVDKLLGKSVPDYFEKLKLSGEGLSESAFK